jgi:hypothetical protein
VDTGPSNGGSASVTCSQVSYQTASGNPTYASMTPDSASDPDDRMRYRAMVVG